MSNTFDDHPFSYTEDETIGGQHEDIYKDVYNNLDGLMGNSIQMNSRDQSTMNVSIYASPTGNKRSNKECQIRSISGK